MRVSGPPAQPRSGSLIAGRAALAERAILIGQTNFFDGVAPKRRRQSQTNSDVSPSADGQGDGNITGFTSYDYGIDVGSWRVKRTYSRHRGNDANDP